MFQSFQDFINYLETFSAPLLTYQERADRLVEARCFLEAHHLIPTVPVITVTGTNGKGSTVQAVSEILARHGLNVFSFTSPHLMSYTERFTYNLQPIDEKTLLRLANDLTTMMDISRWNFFFVLFFISILLCRELALDCIVLEVGIGGRLDPTNILDASLVILTQIALDHVDVLGDTREAIGFEKAGLLRAGIPLVCGEQNLPWTVFERIEKLQCSLYQINKAFGFFIQENQWSFWLSDGMVCELPAPMMHLGSLSCALQAVRLLFPSVILTQAFMQRDLPNIYLPARYQRLICDDLEFVIDVSHNPAAVEALARFLQLLPEKHTIAIFSGKPTKDLASIIGIMKSRINAWYLVPIEQMNTKALAEFFIPFGIHPFEAQSVGDAIHAIHSQNLTNARVVVFGSFQVAGPALNLLSPNQFF